MFSGASNLFSQRSALGMVSEISKAMHWLRGIVLNALLASGDELYLDVDAASGYQWKSKVDRTREHRVKLGEGKVTHALKDKLL